MAKKMTVTNTFPTQWDAARHVLTATKLAGAKKLDVDRIIAQAGELVMAHAAGQHERFANALDMIVRYGFDSGQASR